MAMADSSIPNSCFRARWRWRWSAGRTVLRIPPVHGYADDCVPGRISWLPDLRDGCPISFILTTQFRVILSCHIACYNSVFNTTRVVTLS